MSNQRNLGLICLSSACSPMRRLWIQSQNADAACLEHKELSSYGMMSNAFSV